MKKKLIALSQEGKLVLKAPDGRTEDIHQRLHHGAFVYLLVDCSSSMEGMKLDEAKRGAINFGQDALQRGYRVGLIQFADEAKLVCDFEATITRLYSRIGELGANGSTNMTDAIRLAYDRLRSQSGLRVMVIVTDGEPDNAQTAKESAQEAKNNGIDIITIGTDDANRSFLDVLASRSELAFKVESKLLGQSIALAAKVLPDRSR